MLTREKFKGIFCLMPTPYTKDGKFDEETFRENVRIMCKTGIHGISTTGTVGEFHTLPWEDHKRLIKALVEEIESDVFSVPGCSGVNTQEAIMKTRYAQECGADAVMNVVPFYQKLTNNECIAFYEELAKACPNIGFVVYNNPDTAKVLLGREVFEKLARIPTVCGSKEIVPDFEHWMNITRVPGLSFLHVDLMMVPSMMWGGKGNFSGMACMKPELVLDAYKACLNGDWSRAKELQYKMREHWALVEPLLKGYSPISQYKCMVNAFGLLKVGPPGKPFIPVPEEAEEKVKKIVRERFSA